MSRIGRAPISIGSGVKIGYAPPVVSVDGPRGALSLTVSGLVRVDVQDESVQVSAVSGHRKSRSMHGLTRTLIQNMVTGVTTGFTKSLEIQGVGYKADCDGSRLTLNVGFSHPVVMAVPDGLTVEVEKNSLIHVRGIDKQRVGELAACIRRVRPPEPYRGKGIRYAGEQVRRKVGKAGGK